MNLIEEIRLLGSSKLLAGVHGAGMANIIWMNKKSNLIDLVSKDYWTESVHRLSYLKDIGYHGIVFDELDSSMSSLTPVGEL
jgi:capsular polysaccharide biosynthesis protein